MLTAKHLVLMSHLEDQWASVCLLFYRNIKGKNVGFQEEDGLLLECLMVLHILSSQQQTNHCIKEIPWDTLLEIFTVCFLCTHHLRR